MAVKKNSLLDPETQAIEDEFENQKEGPYIPAPVTDQQLSGGVPTDPRRTQVADAYKQYLGREGSEEEIGSHLGRGANVANSISNIQGSQEARNYATAPKPSTTTTKPKTTSTASTLVDDETAPEKIPAGAGSKPASYDYVPGSESVGYGDTSRLSGFNTGQWEDPEYDRYSVKNTFGKLATNYEPSPDGVRQLIADPRFREQFPEAELIDHPTDPKIRFYPDDPPVDVLAASGAGGWQWLPEDQAGGGGGGAGGGGGGINANTTDLNALGQSDILAQIQAALNEFGRGEQPGLNDALAKEFA